MKLLISSICIANQNLRIIYDRVESIEVSKESKMQMLICRITPTNNSFAQGEFQILQDLDSSKLKIFIEVFRCLVGEAPDTCEYLINLKPPNACLLLGAENTAWSSIAEAYTPRFRCPLKKGKYVADKITFDASKWTLFPLDKFHFKITYKLYEKDVLTQGIIVYAHFIRVL